MCHVDMVNAHGARGKVLHPELREPVEHLGRHGASARDNHRIEALSARHVLEPKLVGNGIDRDVGRGRARLQSSAPLRSVARPNSSHDLGQRRLLVFPQLVEFNVHARHYPSHQSPWLLLSSWILTLPPRSRPPATRTDSADRRSLRARHSKASAQSLSQVMTGICWGHAASHWPHSIQLDARPGHLRPLPPSRIPVARAPPRSVPGGSARRRFREWGCSWGSRPCNNGRPCIGWIQPRQSRAGLPRWPRARSCRAA